MRPVFSIVVPALNSCYTLKLLLRCLEAQDIPRGRFECLIVDDGSTDETAFFLQSYQPGINLHYFTHPVNKGRSQARNTACEQAEGDFLLFLDADMLPEPDCLSRYEQALTQNPTLDVVSGGRYHIHLGNHAEDRVRLLSQMLNTPADALFTANVPAQFERLRANGQLGGYPSQAMAKLEEQLQDVCAQQPQSLLCANSLITGSVAVRRSLFEKVGGFDVSMRRLEDTDLGVRLWEIGACFGFAPQARAYHMYHVNQADRNNTLLDRQAFFCRHPYQLVLLLYLWFAYHDRPDPSPPSPIFESLTALAAATNLADMDAARELAEIYHQKPWADCVCTQEMMEEYYCEHSGISQQGIHAYLEQAITQGLVAHRRGERYYFDFDHTTNWLRSSSTYQQHELERTRYHWIRNFIPTSPGERASALVVSSGVGRREWQITRPSLVSKCRGIYEVNIPKEALGNGPFQATINLPIPIEHPCQSDVQITRCEPANLLDYLNSARSMISSFPLEQALDHDGGITLRYQFSCTTREYLLSEHAPLASPHVGQSTVQNGGNEGGLAQYFKPTYPAAQLPKAEALLKKIFAGPVRDSQAIARDVYIWILNNRRYLQTFFADYQIIETGFGPCMQQARLFVNLCRLMRVPAREQCGAMFGRALNPNDLRCMVVTGRSYNILTHTWAEFYHPRYGWVPVEFSAADFGRHLLTAKNVADESLREQMIRETDLYTRYYFGNQDPFRLYSSDQAGQVPTYPLVKSKMGQDALKMLALQTRHRLICDISGTAESSDLQASLKSLRESVRPQTPSLPAEVRAPQHMLITSIGSTGDVQPLLGLAHDLCSQGHSVTFALPSMYRERVQKLGFSFAEIGTGTGVNAWHEMFARQAEITDPVEQTRYFVETLAPWLPQMYRELCALSANADVLISPAFQSAARMTHDTSGIPFVSVHFSPFGSSGGKAVREASAPVINRVRQEAGLAPLEDPLGADAASPQLALYAVSKHIFRPPAGWPPHAYLTGYWFFEEESWQPTPALVNFLEAGAPPVVISFGSMPSEDPEALTDLILKAIEQANCRAIIQRGGGGLGQHASLPQNVYAVDFLPHSWLFPRAGCIVHHGGAGTSAAAFRAGAPTVVVPHLLDQPIWAEYARAFGCAGAVIPHTQLTAEKLGAALTQTLSNPRFSRAAARLGEKICAENGVQTARQLIENVARQS